MMKRMNESETRTGTRTRTKTNEDEKINVKKQIDLEFMVHGNKM
jgi:hypothetical protein